MISYGHSALQSGDLVAISGMHLDEIKDAYLRLPSIHHLGAYIAKYGLRSEWESHLRITLPCLSDFPRIPALEAAHCRGGARGMYRSNVAGASEVYLQMLDQCQTSVLATL